MNSIMKNSEGCAVESSTAPPPVSPPPLPPPKELEQIVALWTKFGAIYNRTCHRTLSMDVQRSIAAALKTNNVPLVNFVSETTRRARTIKSSVGPGFWITFARDLQSQKPPDHARRCGPPGQPYTTPPPKTWTCWGCGRVRDSAAAAAAQQPGGCTICAQWDQVVRRGLPQQR